MKVIRKNSQALAKIISRNGAVKKRIAKSVSRIIETVKNKKDQALVYYTRKFDRVSLPLKKIKVSEAEISAAFNELNSDLIFSLKEIIENISSFYREQLPKNFRLKTEEGKILEERFVPVDTAGIYVPAGQSPLVSSVYMSIIPALVSGVKKIVLVSPPNQQGFINPYILAVASLLKIKDIYKIGGAQAIAALAFGTETVPKVDKIAGPGNEYVTEAKRQVFGSVAIDMLAGPSEVAIVADSKASLRFVLKDLDAQIEHRFGLGIVVTTSGALLKQIKSSNVKGYAVGVKDLDEAAEIINAIAPEHLEVFVKEPYQFVRKIRNAGAVFVGDYSPVALGDYVAGPSHVLPTGGTARFFSGLSVYDFLKRIHIVNYTKKALLKDKNALEKIASLENMRRHIESVNIRLENK